MFSQPIMFIQSDLTCSRSFRFGYLEANKDKVGLLDLVSHNILLGRHRFYDSISWVIDLRIDAKACTITGHDQLSSSNKNRFWCSIKWIVFVGPFECAHFLNEFMWMITQTNLLNHVISLNIHHQAPNTPSIYLNLLQNINKLTLYYYKNKLSVWIYNY